MDFAAIQARTDALSHAMTAKAMARPAVTFMVTSLSRPCVHLRWGPEIIGSDYKSLHADTPETAFDAAEAFVASQPSPEEARFKAFMTAVANAVEIGKTNGIDVEFVNPLVAMMKTLSENIITHEKAGA